MNSVLNAFAMQSCSFMQFNNLVFIYCIYFTMMVKTIKRILIKLNICFYLQIK